MGPDDVFWHHRSVRDAVLSVHPRPADDFNLRDADDGSGGKGEGSEGALSAFEIMETKPPAAGLYGVMAEFDDTTAFVEAARRTYAEGYRNFEAYSPFPIH